MAATIVAPFLIEIKPALLIPSEKNALNIRAKELVEALPVVFVSVIVSVRGS